jgi:hypothetical protein
MGISKRFLIILVMCFVSIIVECEVLNAHYHKEGRYPKAGYGFAFYPSQLENTLKILYALPEARQLIAQVNKDGPIGLMIDNRSDAEAYWDSHSRRIAVNTEMTPSLGSKITCILFELHNAEADKRLRNLTNLAARGKMTKESYVESVEKVEHDNAVRASELLQKGVLESIYPAEAQWTVFKSFEDHYRMQQMTGHSDFIADSYDIINHNKIKTPFKRTIPKLYTEEEKSIYTRYLTIKNDLESTQRDEIARATTFLQREFDHLDQCSKGKSTKGCENHRRKLALMDEVLGGNPVYEMLTGRGSRRA